MSSVITLGAEAELKVVRVMGSTLPLAGYAGRTGNTVLGKVTLPIVQAWERSGWGYVTA